MRAPTVAVVVSRFPAVTETFILRELIELERQGTPVVLVPLLRERAAVVHPQAKAWLGRALYTPWLNGPILLENARVFTRRPLLYTGTLLGMLWDLRAHPRGFLQTLAIFPKCVWLGARLRLLGVRHVHAHFASHPAAAAHIMSRVSAGPVLPYSVTVHAYDVFLHQAGLGRKLAEASFIRSISEYNVDFLLDRLPRLDRSDFRVIHCGVDPEVYSKARVEEEFPGEDRSVRVLTIASLRPYKGVQYLIDAIALLQAWSVRIECRVIGSGPLRSRLEDRARERGVASVLQLVGNATEEEVAQQLEWTDLLVLPSIVASDGNTEGIPVSLMEAMAGGVPVVATRVSGIPELVVDGETGRLVEPGDADALARAIREAAEDVEGSIRLAEAARSKVRDEFSLSKCVRRLAAEIDRHSIPD